MNGAYAYEMAHLNFSFKTLIHLWKHVLSMKMRAESGILTARATGVCTAHYSPREEVIRGAMPNALNIYRKN